MTAPPEQPCIDPDNIPETICAGRFNLSFSSGGLATLIFTHVRPKVGPLVDRGQIDEETVVRARIVTTTDNLVALRNLLNEAIKDEPAATTVTGGAGKLN